jgi:hypothetical protein
VFTSMVSSAPAATALTVARLQWTKIRLLQPWSFCGRALQARKREDARRAFSYVGACDMIVSQMKSCGPGFFSEKTLAPCYDALNEEAR